MATIHRTRRWTDSIEEGFIAFTLFAMTAITFANVVARYVFNSNILWAVEATVALFAWLVLIGASYAFKVNAHLGVDVVVNAIPRGPRRALAFVAVAASLAWALIFVWASFEYWWPFVTTRAWYELDDIPLPFFLGWMEGVFNEGEPYEKMPRFIPYTVLPLASLLLLFRIAQAGWRVAQGQQDVIVAGHEAEEMVEEVREREAFGQSAEAVDPRASGDPRPGDRVPGDRR